MQGTPGEATRAPQAAQTIEVKVCRTEPELLAIQRLRYEIYVEEMARPQPHADHAARRIVEALDARGHVLGLVAGHDTVGTLRLNEVRRGVDKYDELYGLGALDPAVQERTVIVTSLMLRPVFRGAGAMGRLFHAVYALSRSIGGDVCFIDCNDPLVPLFRHWGFTDVSRIRHPLYGDVNLMRLDLLDHERLAPTPFGPLLDDPTPYLPGSFA